MKAEDIAAAPPMIDTPAIEKLLGELEALHDKATPGPWYTLDPPWLPSGTETSILAGTPDPRVATFICDFDTWAVDDDDDRKGQNPDEDAALLVAARNAIPTLITTIRALMEAVEEQKAERALLQDILDSRPAINAGLPETYARWSQAIYSGEIFRASLSSNPVDDNIRPDPDAIRSKGDA